MVNHWTTKDFYCAECDTDREDVVTLETTETYLWRCPVCQTDMETAKR